MSDPPRDVDPESLTSWNDNTSADNNEDTYTTDDAATTNMSSDGRLRLQAEPDALNDPRYAGIKVSRKELRPDGVESDSSEGSDSGSGSDGHSCEYNEIDQQQMYNTPRLSHSDLF